MQDGTFIRVSAISSAFAKYGRIPQHVLDRAAARGSCVHRLIFDHMNHIVIPSERWEFMGDKLNGYFDSFLSFWEPYQNSEILIQEEEIKDDNVMIAGTPDLVISHEGKAILLDWKCFHPSSSICPSALQTIMTNGYDTSLMMSSYSSTDPR